MTLLGQGGWTRWPTDDLPTPNILWFCECDAAAACCSCARALTPASAWGQSKEEAGEQFCPPVPTASVRPGSSRAASRAGRAAAGLLCCAAGTWRHAPLPSPAMHSGCAGHLAGHAVWVDPYVCAQHRSESPHPTVQTPWDPWATLAFRAGSSCCSCAWSVPCWHWDAWPPCTTAELSQSCRGICLLPYRRWSRRPSVRRSEYPAPLLLYIAGAVSPQQPGCRVQEMGFSLFILAGQRRAEPVTLGIEVTTSQKRSLSLGCVAPGVQLNPSSPPLRRKAACFGVTSLGGGGTDVRTRSVCDSWERQRGNAQLKGEVWWECDDSSRTPVTRSGKENKQGGVLLRKLRKVHKETCRESVGERGNVRAETGFGICLQACATCCLTNGERKAFYSAAFFHRVNSSCSQASWPALVELFTPPVSTGES